jgi:fatty-acyl-CoA synthase
MSSVSHLPLSPLAFLNRAAVVWATRTAVVEGERRWTYAEHAGRVRRLATELRSRPGLGDGGRVATLLPNVAALLELHYAVPGAGGVLVPMNTRLAAPEYAYILGHSGASLLVVDRTFEEVATAALAELDHPPEVLWVDREQPDDCAYEAIVRSGPEGEIELPADEDALLSINYTSGTTGRPKGVMTTHRGAALHSLGVIAESGLGPRSAYLWTLPMFHCNGWAYTWAVTAAGARHVCLPQVSGAAMWKAITAEEVTHMCAAPTVLTMLLGAPEAKPCAKPVTLFVGGSPPAPSLLVRAAEFDIEITHLYGLTETYGPICVCAWNPDWDDLEAEEQSRLRARQGVATIVSERLRVVDEEMRDVPADGASLGEVVMRGNNVMAGYYRDEEATAAAFRGGWFHSGDLGVMHPDGYLELRDRLKDVIISGGENIATIEIEQALMAHPAVVEASVVGVKDERWGEVPVAFLIVAPGAAPEDEELREFLRPRLARFKQPKRFETVEELPKTGTGKIQKFALRELAAEATPGVRRRAPA